VSPWILRWTAPAALAAGLAGQFLLQHGWLRHANEVRSARTLHTAPSSLAFRLAAGGVKEAAADALWLTVLPKLGLPWADPERKAAWIESVTAVMCDADPRALTPTIYAAYFLEAIQRRHPGIERVVRRAMEAEQRTPFGESRRVNDDAWELPEILGMNLYLFGGPAARLEALKWLREAASKPEAPTVILEFVGALGAREGSPLEGWSLWLFRAAACRNPKWKEYYLAEADRARIGVLRTWARAAEARGGRWPRALDEVLAEAPADLVEALRTRPALRDDLVRDVVLRPDMRDIEIPSLVERDEAAGKEQIRMLQRRYETEHKRPARSPDDLWSMAGHALPPPPRHGTKWDLDPATGEPLVAPDLADPRRTK
jgi:hypothetical protein